MRRSEVASVIRQNRLGGTVRIAGERDLRVFYRTPGLVPHDPRDMARCQENGVGCLCFALPAAAGRTSEDSDVRTTRADDHVGELKLAGVIGAYGRAERVGNIVDE